VRKTLFSLAFLAGCQPAIVPSASQDCETSITTAVAPVDSTADLTSIWTEPARQARELAERIWREEGAYDGIYYLRGENNDKTAQFMDPVSMDLYNILVVLEHGVDAPCDSNWCQNQIRVKVDRARGGYPTIVLDEHIDGTCNRACDSGQDFDNNPLILQNKYESLVRRLNEIYRSIEGTNPR